MSGAAIPRMRTAARAAAEIKSLDPDTEVTEYFIRQIIKAGTIPVVRAGNKAMVNLNDLLELLCLGSDRREPENNNTGGIRRIDAKLPR